jgi:uncharacterized protein YdhG (YjbR/CyaY superfamily)
MRNPKTQGIDEYIALQPEDSHDGLQKIRQIIQGVAPKATETISYHMPAFKYHGMLVGFANWKNHFGFYPWNGSTVKEFEKELTDYETSKGAIQFPKGKSLPVALIKKIVTARMQDNIVKEKLKKEKSGK